MLQNLLRRTTLYCDSDCNAYGRIDISYLIYETKERKTLLSAGLSRLELRISVGRTKCFPLSEQQRNQRGIKWCYWQHRTSGLELAMKQWMIIHILLKTTWQFSLRDGCFEYKMFLKYAIFILRKIGDKNQCKYGSLDSSLSACHPQVHAI